IGQIIPDRQQERFEHCQGRPSALTFGGQIKRIEKSRDRVPINQRTRVSSDYVARSDPENPNRS
uniref:hypothetical protein n=1 Tax=Sphingobium sp. TaxID=1912891 RepID=UPI003B3B1DDB